MSDEHGFNHPVLRNKISPPRLRPNRILRDRLIQQVESSAWSKLTLFCAPAGYGKTSVVNDWAHTTQRNVTWLQLEEEDNLLHNFFTALVYSIRVVFPGFASEITSVINHNQLPAPDQLAHLLLHEIEVLPGSFIQVLDDYHLIHNLDIHLLVKELLEHLPENVHFLISTREEPPFPLARMRAKDEVQEIRMHDLEFSPAEVAQWMNEINHFQLEPGQIQTLTEKTEGWAAGIHLAALSMRDETNRDQFLREFGGSNRFILDFLIEEVLSHLDDETRTFLLKISILDKFNTPLAQHILSEMANLPKLADLEADNLFITAIDTDRNWYRLHPLFSDLLRLRLIELVGDEGVRKLLSLAAEWENENGLHLESVQHYILAGEPTKAGDVAIIPASMMLEAGESARCAAWLDHLPGEVTNPSLGIQLIYGYALISNSQFIEAGKHADIAQGVFDAIQGYLPDPQRLEIQSKINCIRALVAAEKGDIEEARKLSDQALPSLPVTDPVRTSLWLGLASGYQHNNQIQEAIHCLENAIKESSTPEQNTIRIVAINNLAMVYIQLGEFDRGEALSRSSMYKPDRVTLESDPITSIAYLYQSFLAYERNYLEKVEEYSEAGLELAKKWGNLDVICGLFNVRMLYALSAGRNDLAEELFSQYSELARNIHPAQLSYDLFLVNSLRYYLRAGHFDKAQTMLSQSFANLVRVSDFRAENLWIERAIGELWLGNHIRPDTRAKILAIRENCRSSGRKLLFSQISLLFAADEQRKFQKSKPSNDLESTMRICREIGLLRSLIDLLPIYQSVFELCLKSDDPLVRNYARTLITLDKGSTGTVVSPSFTVDVEELSDRELEVIALLAAGLSNAVIAERLVVSPGTVKRHVHNIFEKLGATSRIDAVAKARARGYVK
jgi:LuxR family maltose regulon positive regulatory protein